MSKSLVESAFQDIKSNGYAVLEGFYNDEHIEQWRRLSIQGERDWSFCHGTDGSPIAVGDLVERFPRTFFPLVAHWPILNLMELLMGPFVQLDSTVLVSEAPVGDALPLAAVEWHRDTFGTIPNGYQHPMAVVCISYMQDLSNAAGPLRVIPGSHRTPVTIERSGIAKKHGDEVLLNLEAGDLVIFHNNLLHSSTVNTSKSNRRFFGAMYSRSWIARRSNPVGPNCDALRAAARARSDRRVLRLLGEDDRIFERQDMGFTENEDSTWTRWIAEDDNQLQGKVL